MTEICFPCDKCDESRDLLALSRPAWAQIAGFDSDCVSWLNQAPDEEDPELSLLDALPQVGDVRVLLVRHPFRATLSEPFWTMFCPPLSLLNGWADFPDEIADSGLVETQGLRVVDGGPDLAAAGCILLEVRVVEVLRVDQLQARFPEASEPGEDPLFMPQFPPHSASRSACGPVEIVDADAQGAAGGWVLRQGDAILLYGSWDFHRRSVYAGHLRCSDEQSAALDALCAPTDAA